MRRAKPIIALLLLYAITAWGCEHAGPVETITPGDGPVTLSEIQTLVFDRHCAVPQCHIGGGAPLGLDLSQGNAYGNLVGVVSAQRPPVLRVKAGNPDSSYVVWKIEGDPRIFGERMPRGRDPLSQDEIDAIREWITNGAKDD